MKKTISIGIVLTLAIAAFAIVPTVSANDVTVESSTMIFEGALADNGDGTFTGTIDMTAGDYYITGGPGESIHDGGGFDVYAKQGGEAYVEGYYGTGAWNGPSGTDTYIVGYYGGEAHDAYPSQTNGGPWGSWYDPDCADWDQYSLELTADHWYLRYTATSESPMSGAMNWASMYAAESDLGTQDGAHDGSAVHGGGAQAWDWDCGWGVEVIPLQYLGFDVEITDLGGDNYRVKLSPGYGTGEPTDSPNEAIYPGLDHIDTTATVAGISSGGSGDASPPIIKCKWEYDLTGDGHDGIVPVGSFVHDADPITPGLQVAPVPEDSVRVGYYAVVTDPQSVGTVDHVYVDIWHPDGQFKYQIELHPIQEVYGSAYTKEVALDLWNHVETEHHDLITINAVWAATLPTDPPITPEEDIFDELNEELAYIYYGEAEISYCQPGGWYYVGVRAHDTFGEWSDYLWNRFWYIPTAVVRVDFDAIDYGSVVISSNKWIGGDQDMRTSEKPTVRNIGNTPVELFVWQDDMLFGKTGGDWNVEFDARLSADGTPVVYDPYAVTGDKLGVRIPGVLKLCTEEKLDFSIHVKKGYPGEGYTGEMELFAYIQDNPVWTTPSAGTAPLGVPQQLDGNCPIYP